MFLNAKDIASLYRGRWSIELLLKGLKKQISAGRSWNKKCAGNWSSNLESSIDTNR